MSRPINAMAFAFAGSSLLFTGTPRSAPLTPTHSITDSATMQQTWEAFDLEALEAERRASGGPYLSFLTVSTMHAGVYFLPAGGTDRQQPHDEDELYYVVKGAGVLSVDDDETPIKPGSLVYVKAHAEHRFHSIAEDLTILVFFSTAKQE